MAEDYPPRLALSNGHQCFILLFLIVNVENVPFLPSHIFLSAPLCKIQVVRERCQRGSVQPASIQMWD